MFHYGHKWLDVMEMPLKGFWLANRNINRLLAEMDIRLLDVTNAAQTAESATQCRELLVKEMDEPFKIDHVAAAMEAKPDRDGLEILRRMGKGLM